MTNSQALVWVSCTAWLALSATAAHGQEKKVLSKGIDAVTIAAYEKLGAEYGGWPKDSVSGDFQPGRKQAEGGLPGFRFNYTFPKTNLPEVAIPFGLDLRTSN